MEVVSRDDTWMVGNGENFLADREERPVILHWDGSNIREVKSPVPNPYAYDYALNAVEAVSKDDVWTVGNYGYDSPRQQVLILHWDGTRWSEVPAPSNMGPEPTILRDLAVVSKNDVWAVGSFGFYPDTEEGPLILHWDGKKWTTVSTPRLEGTNESLLYAVEVVAPDDVWVEGYSGTHPNDESLIMHWDGRSWTRVPNPNRCKGATFVGNPLALGHDNVWVRGGCQDDTIAGTGLPLTKPLAVRWDGTQWSIVPIPDALKGGGEAIAPDDIWVMSSYGTFPRSSQLLNWDGKQWNSVLKPEITKTFEFTDIGRASENDIWVVGMEGKKGILGNFQRVPCASP